MNNNGTTNESYKVEINGNEYSISFDIEKGIAVIDGETLTLDTKLESYPDQFSFLVNHESYLLAVEPDEEPSFYRIHTCGFDFHAEVISSRDAFLREFIRASGAGKKQGIVKAPMPGKIISISATPGQEVVRGEGVIIMEAMKMENEIKSPVSGKVQEIFVQEGQAVEKGQKLFTVV